LQRLLRFFDLMLPLRLFANPAFSVANLAGLIVFFVTMGTVFFMTQYFQAVQSYTPLETGLRMLPMTMGTFIVAPFAGLLAARRGPLLPIILEALLASAALFLFTSLSPASSYVMFW